MMKIHWLSIVALYLWGVFFASLLGFLLIIFNLVTDKKRYFLTHKKDTLIKYLLIILCSWYGAFACILWFLEDFESCFYKRKNWYLTAVFQWLQSPTLTPKKSILKNYFQLWYNRERYYKVTPQRMLKHFKLQYECEVEDMRWEYGKDILARFLRRKGC